MHYRRLGHSGLKVSEISLGAWVTFGNQIEEQAAIDLIRAAYEEGVNFFDNADMYSNGQAEVVMGKAIRDLPREALVISSKVFWPTMPGPNGRGLSRKHISESINATLRRMHLDYIDLYFCHRFDPDTPLEETMGALDSAVRQGKALYVGISSYNPDQTQRAAEILHDLGTPCLIHQPSYNMFDRWIEGGLLDVLVEEGIGCIVFSPLAQGQLTGRYLNGIAAGARATKTERVWLTPDDVKSNLPKVQKLNELAQQRGQSLAQMAIAWVLRKPAITSALIGASSVQQLDDNLAALNNLQFSDEELEKIESILK